MSVYKPRKSRFWQFDFVLDGRRFHGSTGQATRRAAETVERQKRLEAATGQLGAVANLTLDEGAGRWWAEVGIHRGDAVDVERRISRLIELIGGKTKLSDINQVTVADAIATRRGQFFAKSKAADAKLYPVTDSTVNRDVIETLRPIVKRARTHWTPKGVQHGLPEIDWRELRLREPRALSRIYSPTERAAWLASCQEDLQLALDMMLTYGLRYGELFFPLDAFAPDPEEPTLTLQKGRKRDVVLHLPIRRDHGRELAARIARARAAGLDHAWFWQDEEQALKAYTPSQVEYRLTKAADAAKVTGGRRIHGARHHAGSTILKRTKNLKAVQGLLGHASITSSQRYAHVLIADLREALEDDVPRNSPEPDAKPAPVRRRKALQRKG